MSKINRILRIDQITPDVCWIELKRNKKVFYGSLYNGNNKVLGELK